MVAGLPLLRPKAYEKVDSPWGRACFPNSDTLLTLNLFGGFLSIQKYFKTMVPLTSHLLELLSSKRQEITSVGKDVGKREHLCTMGGNVLNKLIQPLWKTVRRFLKKLTIQLPYDPAIPLLGIYLKKVKTGS